MVIYAYVETCDMRKHMWEDYITPVYFHVLTLTRALIYEKRTLLMPHMEVPQAPHMYS